MKDSLSWKSIKNFLSIIAIFSLYSCQSFFPEKFAEPVPIEVLEPDLDSEQLKQSEQEMSEILQNNYQSIEKEIEEIESRINNQ